MHHCKHSKDTLKHKVHKYLESSTVEVTIILLIVIDVLLLSTEAFIDQHWLCLNGRVASGVNIETLKAMDTKPDSSLFFPPVGSHSTPSSGSHDSEEHQYQRRHESASHQRSSATRSHSEIRTKPDYGPISVPISRLLVHPDGHVIEEVLVCETKVYVTAHSIAHTCHILSICILAIFMVELCTKIWLDPQEFFSSRLEVGDFVIVSVSLVVDILLLLVAGDGYAWIPLLLVFCRLWRIVRATHAVAEIVHIELGKREELDRRLADIERQIAAIKVSKGCGELP